MSDEAAFLDALRANPADDTTRLVYADWLDERGDDRARYVRLVCALVWMPPEEVLTAPAAEELRTLSPYLNPNWEKVVGGRFEVALLEFTPESRDLLIGAVTGLLKLSQTSATDTRLAEAMVVSAPTPLRSRLTCLAATTLYHEWRSKYSGWFRSSTRVVARPIPNPAHSATGLFDVTLRKLPEGFWLKWPQVYKTPVSALLNLPTRQAADRMRRLPAFLFRAVRFEHLEMTLRRTRRAFNQSYCAVLPLDALEVATHTPDTSPAAVNS